MSQSAFSKHVDILHIQNASENAERRIRYPLLHNGGQHIHFISQYINKIIIIIIIITQN
ncbi:hypothetical protein C0J52_28050 [Blattella germanica]|nr:hypothetical protein C0J52_28050 [Blattella germanica]